MYFCLCKSLKAAEVLPKIRAADGRAEPIIASLGLDDPSCCGRCAETISNMLGCVRDNSTNVQGASATL